MSKHVEGLLSNPFFVYLKIDKEKVRSFFKIYGIRDEICDCGFYFDIYYHYNSKISQARFNFPGEEEKKKQIIKELFLEMMIENNLIDYFVKDDEEKEKIIDIFNRKQFTAKIFSIISSRIECFFSYVKTEFDFVTYFKRDLDKRFKEEEEKYILSTMKDLKILVDKIASGVKNICFLSLIGWNYGDVLDDELTEYVKNKYGYRYLSRNYYGHVLFGISDEKVLSYAIINDKSFWNDKHLFVFLNNVIKYNDLKHAEKIIDYAFEKCKEDGVTKYLIDNKLPLRYSFKPIETIKLNASDRFYNKIRRITDSNYDENKLEGLMYPLANGFEKEVEEGKELFSSFLKDAYENDKDSVLKLFEDVDTIIQEESRNKRQLSIRDMLEFDYFLFEDDGTLRKFIYDYFKFGSKESILGRFYYRLYAINEMTGKFFYACAYDYFYDLFDMIDNKLKIKCKYKRDTKFRDEKYNSLKELLAKYGFEIDEKYKINYICSLLDRKYASIEEMEIYAELEQFGDAIYQLAVDNILFYNPESELNHTNEEKYVSAEFQKKIALRLGIEKMYISKLQSMINEKYDSYSKGEMGLSFVEQGNYLSDSLEMIIGAVAKEFGVQRALDFATKLVIEQDNTLVEPQILKFDLTGLHQSKIDKDYLSKIYPGPFDSNYYYSEQLQFATPLGKLLNICIFGNDTKEKRVNVSGYYYNIFDKDPYEFIVCYLYNGIEKTIKIYKPIVESSYSKNK